MGKLRRIAILVGTVQAFIRPSLPLRAHSVQFPRVQPSEVRDRFQARLADHADIVTGTDDVMVARFAGRAGLVPYRTVEVVRLSDDRISFDHLRGPFVRCHETFDLWAAPGGTTVTHTGSFTMRGGLIGWLAGLLWARRLFEHHVAVEIEHMATDEL